MTNYSPGRMCDSVVRWRLDSCYGRLQLRLFTVISSWSSVVNLSGYRAQFLGNFLFWTKVVGSPKRAGERHYRLETMPFRNLYDAVYLIYTIPLEGEGGGTFYCARCAVQIELAGAQD